MIYAALFIGNLLPDLSYAVGCGIKLVSAAPGLPQHITVKRVETAPSFLRLLSERLVLISTGQRHFGRFIVSDVMNRYLSGETAAVFRELETINQPLIQSLAAGDLMRFAEAVNAHSACLDRLSPMIYGEELRALREECLRFTDACCICGAGGGGYLWAIRKENVADAQLREIVRTDIRKANIL